MSVAPFKVEYPPVDRTSVRPQAYGTSGTIIMSGLEGHVVEAAGKTGVLRLKPVNSRRKVTPTCYVDVPLEKKALRELMAQLQQLEATLP